MIMSSPVLSQYAYVVYFGPSDVKCYDVKAGTNISQDPSSVIPMQKAVDTAKGKPILADVGTYDFAVPLNIVDKNVWLDGVGNVYGTGITRFRRAGGDVINMKGTDGVSETIHLGKLYIDGVDKTGNGIRANDVRHCWDLFHDVAIQNCKNGIHLTRAWYDNIYGLAINNCGRGLWVENNGVPHTMQGGGNTLYFFGGKLNNCDEYNLYMDNCHDATFYSTIMEVDQQHTPQYSIKLDTETEQINFIDCSLETFQPGSTTVHDEGRNHRFYNCRFQLTGDGDYTAYEAVNARSTRLIGNVFGANTTGNCKITIDSTSSNIGLYANDIRRWMKPKAVIVEDNSKSTVRIGNPFVSDKIPSNIQFGGTPDFNGPTSTFAQANAPAGYISIKIKGQDMKLPYYNP